MESTTSEALAICTLKQENLREFSNTILTDYFQSCYQKKMYVQNFKYCLALVCLIECVLIMLEISTES